MDDRSPFSPLCVPTAQRPLLGVTVLIVEDSRFACDAFRLLCLRSGARIRRADCLASARRHLQIYRPTVVMVDMGLPDGSGAELIKELVQATPRVDVVLAISGDDFAQPAAEAAGADGFLAKPVSNLSLFQQAILSRLPDDRQPVGPRKVSTEEIKPDPAAYLDDLLHASDTLQASSVGNEIDYVAQFLAGIARSASDKPLLDAVEAVTRARRDGEGVSSNVARLTGLVQERLSQAPPI